MKERYLLFYRCKDSNNFGYIWIYGEKDLRREIKLIDQSQTEIMQVIQVFDYVEIDIDNYEQREG